MPSSLPICCWVSDHVGRARACSVILAKGGVKIHRLERLVREMRPGDLSLTDSQIGGHIRVSRRAAELLSEFASRGADSQPQFLG